MVSTLHCRATDFQNRSILQNCNSIPVKQWLPVFPSPSPRQPLFYLLSVPLWTWLLCEPHKSGIMEYLSCCGWLISFSMMFAWLVHVVTCDRFLSFLRHYDTPLYVWTTFCLSFCLLLDTWVASTSLLLWNANAVNTEV